MGGLSTFGIGVVALLAVMFGVRRISLSTVDAQAHQLRRLEEKVDALLRATGADYVDPYDRAPEAVLTALAAGKKIQAIKIYREITRAGLKEAKDFVEVLESRMPPR